MRSMAANAVASGQRAAVQGAPQWADARYNLGIALYRSGDHPGAAGEFRRVLELNPDFTEAWSYLGNLLESALAEWEARSAAIPAPRP